MGVAYQELVRACLVAGMEASSSPIEVMRKAHQWVLDICTARVDRAAVLAMKESLKGHVDNQALVAEAYRDTEYAAHYGHH